MLYLVTFLALKCVSGLLLSMGYNVNDYLEKIVLIAK